MHRTFSVFLFRKNPADNGRSNHRHALIPSLQFKNGGRPEQFPLFTGNYRRFSLFRGGFPGISGSHRSAGRRQCMLNQHDSPHSGSRRNAGNTGKTPPQGDVQRFFPFVITGAILQTENSSMEEAESLFNRVSISCSDSAHIRAQHCSLNRTLAGEG